MANDIEVLVESLEICAERAGDIVPAVFADFFQRDEGARQLMEHSDQLMQGRMFESVLDLLMNDELFAADGYLDWELDNHLVAYAATPGMYQSFFDSIVKAMQEGLGEDWNDRYADAWHKRIGKIMDRVKHFSEDKSAAVEAG